MPGQCWKQGSLPSQSFSVVPTAPEEMKPVFASWKGRRNLWEVGLLWAPLKWGHINCLTALKENHGTYHGKPQSLKGQAVLHRACGHGRQATLALFPIPRLARILEVLDYGSLRCASHLTLDWLSNVSVALTTVFFPLRINKLHPYLSLDACIIPSSLACLIVYWCFFGSALKLGIISVCFISL